MLQTCGQAVCDIAGFEVKATAAISLDCSWHGRGEAWLQILCDSFLQKGAPHGGSASCQNNDNVAEGEVSITTIRCPRFPLWLMADWGSAGDGRSLDSAISRI